MGQTSYQTARCLRCENLRSTVCLFVCFRRDSPPLCQGLLIHEVSRSQRRTTVGRTPLEEWSASHRDLYLTTHNTHNRQSSMRPGGIRTHNLSRREAADSWLRPRGHWDRRKLLLGRIIVLIIVIILQSKEFKISKTKMWNDQAVTQHFQCSCWLLCSRINSKQAEDGVILHFRIFCLSSPIETHQASNSNKNHKFFMFAVWAPNLVSRI